MDMAVKPTSEIESSLAALRSDGGLSAYSRLRPDAAGAFNCIHRPGQIRCSAPELRDHSVGRRLGRAVARPDNCRPDRCTDRLPCKPDSVRADRADCDTEL